ncbi:MAG: capsular biosynthesis protein CpsI, partial [Rickettsiales bacterium]|nr:capsular biosynthesis protein CpsI [Rickettsiales bacterium]
MSILITGVGGFIGFHTAKFFLKKKFKIIGVDNLNNYYDVKLKNARLKQLKKFEGFTFFKKDIQDKKIFNYFKKEKINCIINLAAQAGVRHSLKDPYTYINSNILGHLNLLELARDSNISKFIYASSSSVYGGNKIFPFSINQRVDNPISLYAASKKSTELISE